MGGGGGGGGGGVGGGGDDYLEIKPYNQNILKQLISSGKMVVGPWYILPDLFLVSGESVIRNLQIGLQTARNYGASMQEGYVPDPFGALRTAASGAP